MNIKMKFLGIAAYLVLFVSCNAFENENPDLLAFQGVWKLESFNGGIAGRSFDMDTIDYSITLEVIGEKAKWYIDDEVEVKYDIITTSEDDALLKLNPIETNKEVFSLPRYLYKIENSEARIADSCYDCYSYFFTRKRD